VIFIWLRKEGRQDHFSRQIVGGLSQANTERDLSHDGCMWELLILPREEDLPEQPSKEEYCLWYLKWLADKATWHEVWPIGLSVTPEPKVDFNSNNV
jgi:hypothetical protein